MKWSLLLIRLKSSHLQWRSEFLFLINLEVFIKLYSQIDSVMNIVLDKNHPRDLDVDCEPLQIENSGYFLLYLKKYIISVGLNRFQALLFTDWVGEFDFIELQLRPERISIYNRIR